MSTDNKPKKKYTRKAPSKVSVDFLRTLDERAMTETQREYVALRLNGHSCGDIAVMHGVSGQYVYKVLWSASRNKTCDDSRPEFAKLNEPQKKSCVYKNFALELKERNLRLAEIAAHVGLPSSKLSYFMYASNIPLYIAIEIQRYYFPDLSFSYLFAKLPTPKYIGYSFSCVYPRLKAAMVEKKLRVIDLADVLGTSEDKVIALLATTDKITYEEASLLNDTLFEFDDITELFALDESVARKETA